MNREGTRDGREYAIATTQNSTSRRSCAATTMGAARTHHHTKDFV